MNASQRFSAFEDLVSRALRSCGVRSQELRDHPIENALVGPLRTFFDNSGKGLRATFVDLTWRLAGGVGAPPPALSQTVELIHAGSMIVDDVEDGSSTRRGAPALHMIVGIPLAINAGNSLYFAPLANLRSLELSASRERRVHRLLATTMFESHVGQSLDLHVSVSDAYQHHVPGIAKTILALKTGSLMAAAAGLGAHTARAPLPLVRALVAFGREVGIALQMLDDVRNLHAPPSYGKRHEDLHLRRITWPWAWSAAKLESDAYHRLTTRVAQLEANDDATSLAHSLLAVLGRRRSSVPKRRLQAAQCRLGKSVGSHPIMADLSAYLTQLENSYV